MTISEPVRINRFLADAGLGSRRDVERFVRAGRVRINDHVADLHTRVSGADRVTLDGRELTSVQQHTYIAFNKPAGYVVSRRAQAENEQTVYALLPPDLRQLRYAGRLDRESRGLLFFASDGEFVHRVSHPNHKLPRRYLVQVDRLIGSGGFLFRKFCREGVRDGDELLRARAIHIRDAERCVLDITLMTGKKRQIRRMCARLGMHVRDLYRYSIGEYSLEDMPLAPGDWSRIDPTRVAPGLIVATADPGASNA
ncbi:MAG: rRNA pseudouridine synthase [Leptospiraceae bacterium]|nr:rRNA pseudouridine synthase [Leptospiraceae bacterium]